MDLQIVSGEPRVQDLRLAESLEFERPRAIRQLIERNLVELERYGGLPRHVANPGPEGGRPSEEYYLNEEQALLICMKSEAPRAADARSEIIAVFQAWRHGKLVPARPATIDEIGKLFDTKLEPLRDHLVKHDGNIAYLIQISGETRDRMDDLVPRKEFSKENKQRFQHVVARMYNGECPCCRDAKIIDLSGQLIDAHCDHARGRELNGAYDGWYVCKVCNLRLRDHVFRAEAVKHFDVFVSYLKRVFSGHPAKEPKRIASRPSQNSFEF